MNKNTQPKKPFCYVCLKKLGFAKVVLNPKSKFERYICLNTSANPNECYSILRQFATWGKCSSGCCGVELMSSFDLEKHIETIKGGKYISKYTVWATNLLQKVDRI
jgi:hypothetical protein